jgi:protein O-GlcNAc transferase
MSPPNPDETQREAIRRYQAGDRDAAARLSRAALGMQPRRADSIFLLAVIAADARQHQAAIDGFSNASALEPANALYANALGEALLTAGKTDDAITHLKRAAQLKPDYERAHYNLGRALHLTGKIDDANACFLEALRINPGNANTLNFLGGMMLAKERHAEALAYYLRALAINANFPEAQYNCASSLRALGRQHEAIAHLREAVRLRPQYARAHLLMGQAMIDLGMVPESVASLRAAIALPPHIGEAHRELGQVLMLLGRLEEAAASFTAALAFRPDDAQAFATRFRLKEALCEWGDRRAEIDRLWADARREADAGGLTPVTPMFAASLPWSRLQKKMLAVSHARSITRKIQPLPPAAAPTPQQRLKIGYLSRDLNDHPVGHQVQGVFAQHNRERFDVHAYSFGPDDGSPFRKRIEQGVEHFHDVAGLSIPALAQRIRADGIHLLVDLMGFSGLTRMGAVAMRPAPLQINWLGYPGTMGATFIDYIIGDPIITPTDRADGFTEAIVRLPHTYMPTDRDQPISEAPIRRTDHGLPENAVVFCCFNYAFKIEPSIFDVWMRILKQVDKSVAWLTVRDASAQANLRKEAEARGVDAGRLVFAQRTPSKADHFARHRLADLFLDTHYYNAHVTACDALWAGLPLISCPGDTFASRVSASLVTAAGLPELVVRDFSEYETLAVRLAKSPEELRGLRQKLAAQRDSCPLFDTPRFVRNLERAFEAMWDNAVAGCPPGAFDVVET